MKKTVSMLLAVLLLLSSLTGAFSFSALAKGSQNLISNGDFSDGLTDWLFNATSSDAGLKTDEDQPYVRILSEDNEKQLVTEKTVHVEADTKYELSFSVRVPEGATFDTSKASAPHFAIFEPGSIGVSGSPVGPYYGEGNNTYSYSYASAWTVTRRTSAPFSWTVDGYGTKSTNGYSLFGAKLASASEGFGVSANEVYADWTKVTCVFTTVGDDENPGEADIAVGFIIKFAGGIVDIRDVCLKEWEEPAPSGPHTEADENGVKGGSVTASGTTYTATPYAGNTFDGWYDDNGELISKNNPVTATSASAYYGARFTNTNVIMDSGFENYTANTSIFDAGIVDTDEWAAQDWMVYNMQTATALHDSNYAWANTKAVTNLVHSGKQSMAGTTFHQTATSPVKLQPNTQYALSFWYSYRTSDPNCYVNSITYGIYKPDATADKMNPAGDSMTGISNWTEDFAPGQWKKASLVFTTGDSTDGFLFGFRYSDANAAGESSINKTTLYVDDVVIMPYQQCNITVDVKTSSSVTPVYGSFETAALGDEVAFRVVTEPGLTPTVTVNGTAVTADSTGVYSFVTVADNVIQVVCDGDEARRDAALDKDGNDLSSYQRDLYLTPVWEGDTVYHEPVLFYTGRDTAKLLYPISEIISVRSYDLKTNYIAGVDYEITADGQIKRLEGSRIPVYTGPLEKVPENDIDRSYPSAEDGSRSLAFIGDTVYPSFAISITYEHTDTWQGDEGYNPYPLTSQTNRLSRVIEKLENGEDVNILFFGDSISCGWSSSGLNAVNEIFDASNTAGNYVTNYVINVAPYAPTWMDMVITELRARYPDANITAKNLALGGKDSTWGKNNLAARLKLLGDWTPDLMLLSFACNDLTGGMSSATFKSNMQGIIDVLRDPSTVNGNPDAEVLFWSQNFPNLKCTKWTTEKFLDYEAQLEAIANSNKGVALTKNTSAYAEIIKSKEAVDYLNTNVNHGNDFTARMYAQAVLAALTPGDPADADFLPGDIDNDGDVDLNDVVALAQVKAGWDIEYIEAALDPNGDGTFDLDDVVYLAQHVAEWDDRELSTVPYVPTADSRKFSSIE